MTVLPYQALTNVPTPASVTAPRVYGHDTFNNPPLKRSWPGSAAMLATGLFLTLVPPSILQQPFAEGWRIQDVQPPHPTPERRAGAIMRWLDGIEAVFVPPPPPPTHGWEVQPFQPPAVTMPRRGAILRGLDGTDAIHIHWKNFGFGSQPSEGVPKYTRHYILPIDDGVGTFFAPEPISAGFILHPSLVLWPKGIAPLADWPGYTGIDSFPPDPVPIAYYTTRVLDTGFNDTLRVYSTITTLLGVGETGNPAPVFSIDPWLTGQNDPGIFTDWQSESTTLRYLRARLTINPVAGSVYGIATFKVTVDRPTILTDGGTLTAAASGGTAFQFIAKFHDAPSVTGNAITSTSGLTVTFSAISNLGATAHVWNSAGVEVGGPLNWSASGE